jgi:TIR domain
MLALFYLAMVLQEGGTQASGGGVAGAVAAIIIWAVIITVIVFSFRRRAKARRAAKNLGAHVANAPGAQQPSLVKDLADELKEKLAQQVPKPVKYVATQLKEKFDASRQPRPAAPPPAARPAPPPNVRPAGSPKDVADRPPPSSVGGEIFISYASADRHSAAALAKALRSEGWSVFWDRTIPPGKTFDEVIEAALSAAKCVVVLWSRDSVTSDWVKVEAAEAAKQRILIPAMIAEVSIPLEFRRLQAASLLDWPGPDPHPGFESLAASIAALLGKPRASGTSASRM